MRQSGDIVNAHPSVGRRILCLVNPPLGAIRVRDTSNPVQSFFMTAPLRMQYFETSQKLAYFLSEETIYIKIFFDLQIPLHSCQIQKERNHVVDLNKEIVDSFFGFETDQDPAKYYAMIFRNQYAYSTELQETIPCFVEFDENWLKETFLQVFDDNENLWDEFRPFLYDF